jgi:menaquinone-dependent protoporphyrinogen oxidase
MEDGMETRVLVAYATKYGATAGIAEKIGQVLREAGLAVDVKRADQAGDPAGYQAVVLGSAVYIGRWRKEAAHYLKANEKALAQRPVWLFNSGPLGEGDAAEQAGDLGFPKGLRPIADRINVRDIAVFFGAVDLEKLNPLERLMFKNVKSPIGDFRNWDAIAAWASGIAAALTEG